MTKEVPSSAPGGGVRSSGLRLRIQTRPSLVWFGVLLLATVLRVILGARAKQNPERPMVARRLAFTGTMVVALAWAAGGS
ncbi:MAG: hypothetical protein MUO50_18235 [Longimicrobiales bacterium]|nr:hypothetical protein [Longimicrobiales bacterium]